MPETPSSVQNPGAAGSEPPGSSETKKETVGRAEVDTSLPFESVKEAVSRFGGSGVWRPPRKVANAEVTRFKEVGTANVEDQTAKLEKELIMKERETLEVLKELETTKRVVEQLKLKVQNETTGVPVLPDLGCNNIKAEVPTENPPSLLTSVGKNLGNGSSSELILMELQQAKVNLNKTTGDLAGVQASVESLSRKLEKEKASLQKTREKLVSDSVKISLLEEELNKTRSKLRIRKEEEAKDRDHSKDISQEIQHLSSEAEQFRKMAEAAKSEISKAMAEIEQTKMSIRIAEIRWNAAKKMKEAAKAAEAVALAEIKAITNTKESITLSYEDYVALTKRAQEAEEIASKRIKAAVAEVDEAETSKKAILKKVEEASVEVVTSRKALEEALNRVEAAKRGKLAVEEALRKWRSENGQKRRIVHNSTKFKHPHPSNHRRDSRLLDLSGMNRTSDVPDRVHRPSLSIGQILSRKIFLAEDFEMRVPRKNHAKPRISLGQLLGNRIGVVSPPMTEKNVEGQKQFPAKRKKFGFTRITLLLAKELRRRRSMGPTRGRKNSPAMV